MTSTIPTPVRIAVAGSVCSTRATLEALLAHNAWLVGVLQLAPEAARNVCGYVPLADLAESAGVPCQVFESINSGEVVEQMRLWRPDLLFVVGLSQLVKLDLLSTPRLGCVGFHPTCLPAGRGRAPLAWLTYDASFGAATFFLMNEEADAGPIFVQEPFAVNRTDYAADVEASMLVALRRALDRWLPKLLAGEWNPHPQDQSGASFQGRRAPADGLINWERPAGEIMQLVRCASRPHPGAYTYLASRRIIVWRAEREEELPIRGVAGRIVHQDPFRGPVVQTGDGLIRLTEVQIDPPEIDTEESMMLRVGVKLGYAADDEIYSLRRQMSGLEERLAALEARLQVPRGEHTRCG